jgi:hypothetical protein
LSAFNSVWILSRRHNGIAQSIQPDFETFCAASEATRNLHEWLFGN